jgi:hypothetical protein
MVLLQYCKCSNANTSNPLVPRAAVLELQSLTPEKYQIPTSATFSLNSVFDVLLDTMVLLLSVEGLLRLEIFVL